ncbi:hypothetical protein SNE40_008022 [Patella caerulea]|uniref:Uncharacterized protein n=1 Tax=Patella caerulea TaxID=87958 RepID=A0AAN8JUV8_PATCE
MAFSINIVTVLLAFVSQEVSAQMFRGLSGLGLPGLGSRPGAARMGMLNGQSVSGAQVQNTYRTCIGQTAAGDELRVTFSERPRVSTNWWSSNGLQVTADITSGSMTGMFQLVTTEYGRIDGMCESASLGEIITNRPQANTGMFGLGLWNQGPANNIGVIGTTFDLNPGKTVSLTDNINTGLTLARITGGGMALCPVRQVVGNRCIDMVSLCCSIAKDSRPASQQVASGAQGGNAGGINNAMGGFGNIQTGALGNGNAGNMQMGSSGNMNAGVGGLQF